MNQVNEDPVQQFARTLYNATGAEIEPVPDGEIHRFDDPNGRRGNKSGWYLLHTDGHPAGQFGSWKTGATTKWRYSSGRKWSSAETARNDKRVRDAKANRARERAAAQSRAAQRAKRLWENASPAAMDHPYLQAKSVPATFLRQQGEALLVPLRTMEGELVNIQYIYPDSKKRFLRGGRITGGFALFGQSLPDVDELYICEGWATAATIVNTLKIPVVAAMNAGNLQSVAETIRAARPRLALVIAADNDHKTPGNPGITKGSKAARSVQGALTWPSCCMAPDCNCTDFNDIAHCGRAPR